MDDRREKGNSLRTLAWSLGTSLRRVADDETFVSDSQILGKGEPWGEEEMRELEQKVEDIREAYPSPPSRRG